MADVTHEDGDGAEKLHRIRNMWQFANLCQWIYIFGKSAKINESIDIEVCEPSIYNNYNMTQTAVTLVGED